MTDVTNELVFGLWTLTLSARGLAAVLLVLPVSAVLIAFAWRIAGRTRK